MIIPSGVDSPHPLVDVQKSENSVAAASTFSTSFSSPDTAKRRRYRGGKRVSRAIKATAARNAAMQRVKVKQDQKRVWQTRVHVNLDRLPKDKTSGSEAVGLVVKAREVVSRKAHDKLVKGKRVQRELAESAADLHPSNADITREYVKIVGDVRALNEKQGTHAKTIAGARGLGRRLRKKGCLQSVGMAESFYDSLAADHDTSKFEHMREMVKSLIYFLVSLVVVLTRYSPSKYVEPSMKKAVKAGKEDWIVKLAEQGLGGRIIRNLRMFYSEGKQAPPLTDDLMRWLHFIAPDFYAQYDTPKKWVQFLKDRIDFEIEMMGDEKQWEKKSQKTRDKHAAQRRRLAALRVLLLMAGIEPNPGPMTNGDSDSSSSSAPPPPAATAAASTAGTQALTDTLVKAIVDAAAPILKGSTVVSNALKNEQEKENRVSTPKEAKKKTNSSKSQSVQKVNRSNKKQAAIAGSLMKTASSQGGTIDALREKLSEANDDKRAMKFEIDDACKEIAAQRAIINLAKQQGFVPHDDEGPCLTYAFHGKFRPGLCSTFDDTDPLVTINVYPSGLWISDAHGTFHGIQMMDSHLCVASNSVSSDDKTLRCRNIYNGLIQSKDVAKEIKEFTAQEKITYMRTLELRAFLLCGTIVGTGRCRWLNDCEEWVVPKYTVEPPLDWEEQLDGVILAYDTQKFESQVCRQSRAAPYVVQGLVPHVPDASHMPTLIAGLCKRLFPRLPARSDAVLDEIQAISDDLATYILNHADTAHLPAIRTIIEEALAHHPLRERQQMMEGADLFLRNSAEAIAFYNDCPYKCFIKLESYPDGTFKPPRFIMSLTPKARGIQIAAMGQVLWLVESGTRLCNVKGLTADEITAKLKEKFKHIHDVAETDFSSFESCIGPDLKHVLENNIFDTLAQSQVQRDFVSLCLERPTVLVKGPVFTIPAFHHIRMSGDYWTSLGNLLSNIVLTCFATGWSVDEVIERGIFEGDDGCYPAPQDPEFVMRRAEEAGVKLTFAIAPVSDLSFCGNHFEYVDGNLVRFRDPQKCLANATILFNAPRGSLAHDRMLQRSKIMAYLMGPIVKDMWVFACVVERFTRDVRIDPALLQRMGLAKMYSSCSLEECVPDYLKYFFGDIPLSDDQFCRRVYRMNKEAGGRCELDTIVEMVRIARAAGVCSHCVLPNPLPVAGTGAWYARDGARFTHKNTFMGVPVVQTNVSLLDSSGKPVFKPRKEFRLTAKAELAREGYRFSERLTSEDLVPFAMKLALICVVFGVATSLYVNHAEIQNFDDQCFDWEIDDSMCEYSMPAYGPEPKPVHYEWSNTSLVPRYRGGVDPEDVTLETKGGSCAPDNPTVAGILDSIGQFCSEQSTALTVRIAKSHNWILPFVGTSGEWEYCEGVVFDEKDTITIVYYMVTMLLVLIGGIYGLCVFVFPHLLMRLIDFTIWLPVNVFQFLTSPCEKIRTTFETFVSFLKALAKFYGVTLLLAWIWYNWYVYCLDALWEAYQRS